jgi:hypothetical protein
MICDIVCNKINIFFFVAGPTGGHPIRTITNISQRPFPDAMFTSHLRDLESLRRKSSPLSLSASHSHYANGNLGTALASSAGALDSHGGYKPNAPQIQGKTCCLQLF